jgi:hypothetical protein
MKHIAIVAGLAILMSTLVLRTPAFAHGNETHVLGVVKSFVGDKVAVSTAKGDVVVTIAASTTITRGNQSATREDLKPGDRVVIHARKEKGVLTATEIRLGEKAESAGASHVPHQH